ncbi:TRAP transporter large permease [Amorphus sp. 3PC139-8]|uniref:TRAP transporter large permease n=1 Tax=Amorphus sp. 3PC139-8 TaxID=2735676 RepID=UPI00345DA8E3
MSPIELGLFLLALLAVTLGSGVWIFAALILVSIVCQYFVLGFPLERIGIFLQSIAWRAANSWELSAIPLFLVMGEIISRTDIADRLFRGLTPWLEPVPGRLLHVNIAGSTIFAAVSGSSTATTSAVGRVTLPVLLERGYSPSLALGSLAGAGSLGLLIPPSIIMIIYGVLAEVSIAKLFIGGVLPGLLIAALYSAYIMARCLQHPERSPRANRTFAPREYWGALIEIAPFFILITVVLGGIYAGFVTPSEAAAIGVAATLVIAGVTGQLSFRLLSNALHAAVKTSCMICFIVVSAAILSSTLGFLHLPLDVATAIASLDLSPYALILFIGLLYIVLGLFLDGISIAVMTLPITLPLVLAAGYDPLWFGIFLVINIELGLITPPVGLNLFVLQGLTREPLGKVAAAAMPFFCLLIVAVVLITLFPGLALWLPNLVSG